MRLFLVTPQRVESQVLILVLECNNRMLAPLQWFGKKNFAYLAVAPKKLLAQSWNARLSLCDDGTLKSPVNGPGPWRATQP
jgi:hypothetical protein